MEKITTGENTTAVVATDENGQIKKDENGQSVVIFSYGTTTL